MRTIWKGSISFGLVNIPIGLAVATQRSDIAFRTLHRECGTPIKQKRWCPTHDRAPADVDAQRRPYVLLLEAMRETGMAAVGKFVLWGKENLCLLRPLGSSLALQTLFYSEDIRARGEIDDAVGGVEVRDPELDLAKQVIQSLVGDWQPDEFENEYRGQLKALLEAKLAGAEFVVPEPVEEAPVVDLMEALRRSVDEARDKKAAVAADGKKKAPARSRAKAKA